MQLKLTKHTVVVVDLDDTLCYEADFVHSGLSTAAAIIPDIDTKKIEFLLQQGFAFGVPPFDYLFYHFPELKTHKLQLLSAYRNHLPKLTFRKGAKELLQFAKRQVGGLILISDGRTISQRNKLVALGIQDWFDAIFISEEVGADKRDRKSFDAIHDLFPGHEFLFIGDNPAKDFLQPLLHGWTCIGLLTDGRHIHPQPETLLKQNADVTFVHSLTELEFLE